MSTLLAIGIMVAGAIGQAVDPSAPPLLAGAESSEVAARLADLISQTEQLNQRVNQLASDVAPSAHRPRALEIFHGYMGVFVAAFVVALAATPIMRRLAISQGIIDRPSVARKIHKLPVAYLGGVAVYLGIMAGVLFAFTTPFHGLVEFHQAKAGHGDLPPMAMLAVMLGLTVIMICGLVDDVVGIDPRAKIAGMLFAAAALATQDVGVKVAAGLIVPVTHSLGLPTSFSVPLPGSASLHVDLIYWIGTGIIAVFVLGACNASNLIDGLDGLLSGTTAIASGGLLVIALGLAVTDDGPLDAARIVLCLALLGACLGFLPHNFNPATIFLGDAGSLMLGYLTIVIVLTLGDTGRTNLVLAGLIIYAIPIIDTFLAIVRRKVSGKKISDADDQHLHHMLKRALGVKGAVFVLYGIGIAFAALGIALSEGRGRVTYALTLVFAAFIGVTAFKVGRKAHFEKQAEVMAAGGRGKLERPAPPEPLTLGATKPANGSHTPEAAARPEGPGELRRT